MELLFDLNNGGADVFDILGISSVYGKIEV